jgi:hypothetical protein
MMKETLKIMKKKRYHRHDRRGIEAKIKAKTGTMRDDFGTRIYRQVKSNGRRNDYRRLHQDNN